MKRYVEVFWTPWYVKGGLNSALTSPLHLLTQEPKPLVTWVCEQRANSFYLKCPAVIESMKNCFVVTAPFDLNIKFDLQNYAVYTDRFGQDFFETYVNLRNKPDGYPALISLPPAFLFYAKESVKVQVDDLPIITSDSSKNTKMIPGEYDIGKWVRPLDWTFEFTGVDYINVKMGDPLFTVRFKTKNDLPVKLIRVEPTANLINKVVACTAVKGYVQGLSLKTLYELAKNYLGVKTNK